MNCVGNMSLLIIFWETTIQEPCIWIRCQYFHSLFLTDRLVSFSVDNGTFPIGQSAEFVNILVTFVSEKLRRILSTSTRPAVNQDCLIFIGQGRKISITQLFKRNQNCVGNVFLLVLFRRADIENNRVGFVGYHFNCLFLRQRFVGNLFSATSAHHDD